ncbi:MAG: ABC transporter permease subunit [Oscillospiraceae bacterium]|nr:ABC transporter permease subunit [Oscillospiraceae bacterium]
MSKLLRADFIRLFKSRIFWLGLIFMVGLAGVAMWTNWKDSHDFPDYYNPPDGLLFVGAAYIGIVIAVVLGIFIGTDYSHGTIRNKISVGHSRMKMYFSNLIVCTAASLIMHIAFMIVIIGASVTGIAKKFDMTTGNVAALIFTSIFTVAALSSIFILVCMLISSRSAGVVTTIILSLALIMSANNIYYRLLEKEYTEPYSLTLMTESGEEIEITQESVKNPKYLTGTKRKVYQFLADILPNNQIMQLSNGASGKGMGDDGEMPDHTALFPLYSLGLIAVTTAAGILIFRRKDLK